MKDREILKMLGITDKTIDITLNTDIQAQVNQRIDEYLKEREREDKQKRDEFYNELREKAEETFKLMRNSFLWYGR